MHQFTYIIERCPDTHLLVGYVPGLPGAHSQGDTFDELHENMIEALGLIIEDGSVQLESEFVGVQNVSV